MTAERGGPTVAVVGLGAIGGYVAGVLAHERPQVRLRAVTGRPVDRLVIETKTDGFTVDIDVLDSVAEVDKPADWVLVCTKAHQIGDVTHWLEALIGPATRVAVFQNGIDHASRVERWVPAERVVPVVVRLSSHRESPGHVVARSRSVFDVPADPAGEALADLLGGGKAEVNPTADFDRAMWRKLALNTCGGAIAAAAGRPMGAIDDARLPEIAHGLIDECVAAAATRGVALDHTDTDPILDWVLNRGSMGAPSTLQDRLAGRPLEIDIRNGAVVAVGAAGGVPTPWNQAMLDVLRTAHTSRHDLLDAVEHRARELMV